MPGLAVTFRNLVSQRHLSGHPARFVKPEVPAGPAWLRVAVAAIEGDEGIVVVRMQVALSEQG